MATKTFRDLYSDAYRRVQTLRKESRESLQFNADLGHPDFSQLKIGETAESRGVVFFLDIRGFTKMSFALPNDQLVIILQALTEASVRSIQLYGGHVIEFTGDGVMAVFGDAGAAPQQGAVAALQATGFLMQGIRDYLNPQLAQLGSEPIRTAVGMEFGTLTWSRLGVENTTQVKPISDVTFLAGKLSTSSFTKAWESKVGANLAAWIPEEFKEAAGKYSFTLAKTEYSRDLFLFKWEAFAKAVQSSEATRLLERMNRTSLPSGASLVSATASSSSARVLKDQPFF